MKPLLNTTLLFLLLVIGFSGGASGQDFEEIMRLTDFNAQHGYAPGKTTTRFNHVIAGLNQRTDFQSLTPVQQRKWTMALKHNKFDVDALPVLMKAIGQDEPGILGLSTKSLFSGPEVLH